MFEKVILRLVFWFRKLLLLKKRICFLDLSKCLIFLAFSMIVQCIALVIKMTLNMKCFSLPNTFERAFKMNVLLTTRSWN